MASIDSAENPSTPTELTVRYAGATMTQPVLVVSPQLTVRFANDPATELLGTVGDNIQLENTAANLLALDIAQHMPQVLATGRDTIFETTFAERTWLCHIVPLRDSNDTAYAASVFCHDVSHIHAHAQRQLAAQKELTEALVLEVRHRVKNHLQGVVGLLRQHQMLHPDAAASLDTAITQLMTISTVYGLEAREREDHIYLCSVVGEIVRTLQQTYRLETVIAPPLDQRAVLNDEYAVPVALVANELITNAIKHTADRADREISIDLEFTADLARLKIFNRPAQLSTDHDDPARHKAGLGLVRALLPIGHASLSLNNHGDGVVAALTLLPPVVVIRGE